MPPSAQVGGRVGFSESNLMLDIAEHRPDIGAVLAEAVAEAAKNAPGADVGVYVAGWPPPAPASSQPPATPTPSRPPLPNHIVSSHPD